MARRTKEDALATRDGILDAAERLFAQQGVSGTTLQHIATAAGVTRGAIYWHFEDKGALFNAMMERATTPLEGAMRLLDASAEADPLHALREYAVQVFRLTLNDAAARRAFEIATLKIEYVEELSAVRERKLRGRREWMTRAERIVQGGIRDGHLKAGARPAVVALGLYVLMEGLVRNWLIDPDYDLVGMGGEIIDMHLQCLRA